MPADTAATVEETIPAEEPAAPPAEETMDSTLGAPADSTAGY